jgi:hypothetical protein
MFARWKARALATRSTGRAYDEPMKRFAVLGVLVAFSASAEPVKREVKQATKAQRAAYKKHVKAGWAFQRASKWADATREFDQALVAVDGDPRALTELGFSAMNAGDFAKARKADEQAIQLAVDSKTKASALYNLGLVFEKSGDKIAALRSYLASLQLRPHKAVEQAVTRLGAKPEAPPPFCEPGAKPCDCIRREAFDEIEEQQGTCELSKDVPPVKGFHIYHIDRAFHFEHADYLLDEHDQLVAVLSSGFESGHGRNSDEMTLSKAEVTTVGGHQLLRIETVDELTITTLPANDDDEVSLESHTRTLVTLCEVGIAKTRCPLREVPLIDEYTGTDPTKAMLDLAVTPDGVATIKLVKGATDAATNKLIGPHKLW